MVLQGLFGSQASSFTSFTGSCPGASFRVGDQPGGPCPAGRALAPSPCSRRTYFGSGCPKLPGLDPVSTCCFARFFPRFAGKPAVTEQARNETVCGNAAGTPVAGAGGAVAGDALETLKLLCTNSSRLIFFLALQQASKVVFSSCVMLWSRKLSRIFSLPVPIWEHSGYQQPLPFSLPDLGQQAAPLIPLPGGVLTPSPLRIILFFSLSQNWDKVGSKLHLTGCSSCLAP